VGKGERGKGKGEREREGRLVSFCYVSLGLSSHGNAQRKDEWKESVECGIKDTNTLERDAARTGPVVITCSSSFYTVPTRLSEHAVTVHEDHLLLLGFTTWVVGDVVGDVVGGMNLGWMQGRETDDVVGCNVAGVSFGSNVLCKEGECCFRHLSRTQRSKKLPVLLGPNRSKRP
jgi:hypothetical protein